MARVIDVKALKVVFTDNSELMVDCSQSVVELEFGGEYIVYSKRPRVPCRKFMVGLGNVKSVEQIK